MSGFAPSKEVAVIVPAPSSCFTYEYHGKADHGVTAMNIKPVIPPSCRNLQKEHPVKEFLSNTHDQYKVFVLSDPSEKPRKVDKNWPDKRGGQVYKTSALTPAQKITVKNAESTREERYVLPIGKTTFVIRVLAGGCVQKSPPHAPNSTEHAEWSALYDVGNSSCFDKKGHCKMECAVYRDYQLTITRPAWQLSIILILLIAIVGITGSHFLRPPMLLLVASIVAHCASVSCVCISLDDFVTAVVGVAFFWGYVSCIQRQFRARRKRKDPMMEGYDFYDEGALMCCCCVCHFMR
jgi:hypothetical protein